ncbi:MAG: HlyC/CorC family transporter [Acidobacteria bacterium]|nr:HlyC/CorC family transporter [Acidobacteriota bacterium]
MDDADPYSLVLRLLGITALVAVNGFFTAAEFSLVAVRRSRIETLAKQGSRSAKLLVRVLDDIDNYIATTQLGVTGASIGLGWAGEPALAAILGPAISQVLSPFWSEVATHSISVAVAFLLITYILVVVGELVPKTLALERTEQIALVVVWPLRVFNILFLPLIRMLNLSGVAFLRLFRVRPRREGRELYAEEIRHLIDVSQQHGLLEVQEHQLLSNIFKFSDITVKEVMRPRADVTAVECSTPVEEIVAVFNRSGYSRLPVYRERFDQIAGVLYSKDLLSVFDRRGGVDILRLLRPPFFVPETASVAEVLRQMRLKRTHFALVVDEYGGIEGIVTLEDILEELVGEIQDEYDVNEVDAILRQADGSYLLSGTLSIRDANRRLALDLPESDDYATLAGFLMSRIGRLPSRGELIEYEGLRFTVERVLGRRIARVRLQTLAKKAAPM